jgi:hypothetical protein
MTNYPAVGLQRYPHNSRGLNILPFPKGIHLTCGASPILVFVYCQYVRSRVRYWMASATCLGWIFSLASRSAIVRETRRIRS